jgi:hypothetical protein
VPWPLSRSFKSRGDRLTLDVKNQPLATILEMVADQGIRIRIDPRINPRISATFTNRPIGSAIAGMLKTVDYALIWRKDKASSADEPRLWEIRIFYKGQESLVRPLPKSANLNVVKKGDGAYHVKDILLLRLAPTMTEAALNALLDRLGATIIDSHPPLGIVRLRLPPWQRCPGHRRHHRRHTRCPERRTGLCLPAGRGQPCARSGRFTIAPTIAAPIGRRYHCRRHG